MGHEPSIEDGIIKGSIDRDVKSIKLPFKMTGRYRRVKKAVTKKEYQKQAKAFKKKAEEQKK
ncbi:hypothetical protein ACEQPO_29725 [Bacillus sp. SL00103]